MSSSSELALAREQVDRDRRELLGNRPDVEDRLRGVADVQLQVGHP
jgi:hypothetical protein